MFRFADSYYLYLLLLLPLMVALFIWSEWYVRRRISRYGDWKLLSALAVGVSRGRRVFKFVLFVLAYALLIVAWHGLSLVRMRIKSRKEELRP